MPARKHNLDPPPIAYHGSTFHWEVPFVDTATGKPFDFTAHAAANLQFVTELLDRDGQVLATLNNIGSGDGTISGNADGVLAWDLPAAVVNTLPITREYRSSSDPKTWRTRHRIVFALAVTDVLLAETWTLLDSQLVVSPALT